MKRDVSFCNYIDAFRDYDRYDNFSYCGHQALYDYLIEYEESCDTEIELDVIAICCDFTEYRDFEEIQKEYPNIENIEDLRDHTTVIEFDVNNKFMTGPTSGIIIQCF